MTNVKVLVLRAPGINCNEETAYAWELSGCQPDCIHINRLIENSNLLLDYQIFTLPGGFSFGDDIAAGKILANQLQHHLSDAIQNLINKDGLVLGICNGCQVLVRMGLIPGQDCSQAVSITHNNSGRYEDRWVHVQTEVSHCPFLSRGEIYHLPVAHGEGKFVTNEISTVADMGRIALRYVSESGDAPVYPQNPNGSVDNIAALVDGTGRILGLMPHPERNIFKNNSPTRPSSVDGLKMFKNAVKYFD